MCREKEGEVGVWLPWSSFARTVSTLCRVCRITLEESVRPCPTANAGSPEPRSPEPLPTDRHGLTQSPQRGMGRYIVFFLDSHTTTIPTIHLIWTEV